MHTESLFLTRLFLRVSLTMLKVFCVNHKSSYEFIFRNLTLFTFFRSDQRPQVEEIKGVSFHAGGASDEPLWHQVRQWWMKTLTWVTHTHHSECVCMWMCVSVRGWWWWWWWLCLKGQSELWRNAEVVLWKNECVRGEKVNSANSVTGKHQSLHLIVFFID